MANARSERPPYGGGREALLTAAIEVVAASGLRGLTIRSVAEHAKVSHGLVRWHFGSRDGLVEATLIYSVAAAIDTSALEPETGSVDDLAADLPEWVSAQTDLAAFQYECLLEARRKPALMPHVREMYDDFIASVRRELELAGLGDDVDTGRAVFALLDGLALQQTVFGEPGDTKRAVAVAHEMIIALREKRQREARRNTKASARRNGGTA
jgi:AcrR family transcriptional regulator